MSSFPLSYPFHIAIYSISVPQTPCELSVMNFGASNKEVCVLSNANRRSAVSSPSQGARPSCSCRSLGGGCTLGARCLHCWSGCRNHPEPWWREEDTASTRGTHNNVHTVYVVLRPWRGFLLHFLKAGSKFEFEFSLFRSTKYTTIRIQQKNKVADRKGHG